MFMHLVEKVVIDIIILYYYGASCSQGLSSGMQIHVKSFTKNGSIVLERNLTYFYDKSETKYTGTVTE